MGLIVSEERFHAALICYALAGGKFADYLPDTSRPWMAPKIQDVAAMKAALGM